MRPFDEVLALRAALVLDDGHRFGEVATACQCDDSRAFLDPLPSVRAVGTVARALLLSTPIVCASAELVNPLPGIATPV